MHSICSHKIPRVITVLRNNQNNDQLWKSGIEFVIEQTNIGSMVCHIVYLVEDHPQQKKRFKISLTNVKSEMWIWKEEVSPAVTSL